MLEKNINAPQKILRESFLRERIEKIPFEFGAQRQEIETSLLIKKQNKLFKEILLGLNVLAKFFVEGDNEEAVCKLEFLDSLSLAEAKDD